MERKNLSYRGEKIRTTYYLFQESCKQKETRVGKMKCLDVNLIINYAQDLYVKHYKALMKYDKEELNKWKSISCSWIVTIL